MERKALERVIHSESFYISRRILEKKMDRKNYGFKMKRTLRIRIRIVIYLYYIKDLGYRSFVSTDFSLTTLFTR